MEMGEIVIQNVNQVYHNANQGDFNALSDINLHLCKGESLAIEGESGSGKSTLARLLIGIEKPTSGKILLDETLVAYEDGEIVPELAEEWGWDETNTVLTFKLRQDVAFTDGAAFNAESVKEILDFDRSNPNFSGIKGIYNIESVEVVDEYTVAVHYAAPCFSYINDFCFQNVAGMMSPNVFEAENFQTFTDVVGTGPLT